MRRMCRRRRDVKFLLEGVVMEDGGEVVGRDLRLMVLDDAQNPVQVTPCLEDGVLRFGCAGYDVEMKFSRHERPDCAPSASVIRVYNTTGPKLNKDGSVRGKVGRPPKYRVIPDPVGQQR